MSELPNRERTLVYVRDRLRLADVEVEIIS